MAPAKWTGQLRGQLGGPKLCVSVCVCVDEVYPSRQDVVSADFSPLNGDCELWRKEGGVVSVVPQWMALTLVCVCVSQQPQCGWGRTQSVGSSMPPCDRGEKWGETWRQQTTATTTSLNFFVSSLPPSLPLSLPLLPLSPPLLPSFFLSFLADAENSLARSQTARSKAPGDTAQPRSLGATPRWGDEKRWAMFRLDRNQKIQTHLCPNSWLVGLLCQSPTMLHEIKQGNPVCWCHTAGVEDASWPQDLQVLVPASHPSLLLCFKFEDQVCLNLLRSCDHLWKKKPKKHPT